MAYDSWTGSERGLERNSNGARVPDFAQRFSAKIFTNPNLDLAKSSLDRSLTSAKCQGHNASIDTELEVHISPLYAAKIAVCGECYPINLRCCTIRNEAPVYALLSRGKPSRTLGRVTAPDSPPHPVSRNSLRRRLGSRLGRTCSSLPLDLLPHFLAHS